MCIYVCVCVGYFGRQASSAPISSRNVDMRTHLSYLLLCFALFPKLAFQTLCACVDPGGRASRDRSSRGSAVPKVQHALAPVRCVWGACARAHPGGFRSSWFVEYSYVCMLAPPCFESTSTSIYLCLCVAFGYILSFACIRISMYLQFSTGKIELEREREIVRCRERLHVCTNNYE